MDHRPLEIGESNDLVQAILADMNHSSVYDKIPDDWIEWESSTRRNPYMKEIITNEPGHIVFDGYFYIEDETVPVERILNTKEADYHVEIYEKKTLEDTTKGFYDEEFGGYISFFSTHIIDLRYRIISKIESIDQRVQIMNRIEELEKSIIERDEIHRIAREKREYDDQQR